MSDDSELKQAIQDLDRASRINSSMLTVFCGIITLGISLLIGQFETIFHEMLPPGTELPLVTQWVICGKWLLPILIISLVLVALVISFRICRPHHAALLILGCNAVLILMSIIIGISLILPFMKICNLHSS